MQRVQSLLFVPAALLNVAAVLCIGAGAASAQPSRGPGDPTGGASSAGGPPRGPGNDERMRAEVMDRMRTMRMWKVTEELRLDEKQAAQVFPLLARFDERERELARQQAELVRGVRTELDAPGGNPNKANLTRLIDTLLANRGKKFALDEERARGLRKVLDPVQQARLVLLLPRLDEAFRRHIRHALGHDRGDGRDNGRGDGRGDNRRDDRGDGERGRRGGAPDRGGGF